jgi:hypothetical protein
VFCDSVRLRIVLLSLSLSSSLESVVETLPAKRKELVAKGKGKARYRDSDAMDLFCGPMSTLPSPDDGCLTKRVSQPTETGAQEQMPMVLWLDKRNSEHKVKVRGTPDNVLFGPKCIYAMQNVRFVEVE